MVIWAETVALTSGTPQNLSSSSGQVSELQATGWGATVMDEHYGYDKHGNRVSRQSGGFYAATEHYDYDGNNRLKQASLSEGGMSTTTLTASYDAAGNFQSRSDRGGSLAYGYHSGSGADKLASVSGHIAGSFSYDAAGRITSGPDGLTVDYNARGLATVLHKKGHTAELTYAPDGHRYRSVLDGTQTEYYVAGGAFRIVQKSGVTTYREAVVVGGVTVAQLTTRSNATDTFHYFFHDALGSVVAVTGTDGAAHIEHLAYGPYGEMRKGKDWTTLMTPPAIQSLNLPTRRGYTGGEALTALGLVHLGARIYDPTLGRFLSPDPAGASTPYVYVGDNPLSDTDPSGAISVGQVLTIAALVMASVFTFGAMLVVLGGYVVAAGAVTGAIMGFAGGMIASNGNLHAGLMGALGGAAAGATFAYLGGLSYSGGMFEKAAVEGFAGGALSDVEGGSFKDGFIGAFVGSISAGLTKRIPGDDALSRTEKVAAASALGGTASSLTGGSFANGAYSAAFQHLFNDLAHDMMHDIVGVKNAKEAKALAIEQNKKRNVKAISTCARRTLKDQSTLPGVAGFVQEGDPMRIPMFGDLSHASVETTLHVAGHSSEAISETKFVRTSDSAAARAARWALPKVSWAAEGLSKVSGFFSLGGMALDAGMIPYTEYRMTRDPSLTAQCAWNP